MSDPGFILTNDGRRIAYRLDGDATKPVLLLSNSIGTDLHMWDTQMPAFARHFRVLRYDARGHGASDAPAGDYGIERLGRDALDLLDALDIRRVHFLGLSLGGMVGQWLGVHAPERIERLILAHTAANLGPVEPWQERIDNVLRATPEATAAQFLANWFPPAFIATREDVVAPVRAMLLATPARGFAGNYAAVRDLDVREAVRGIALPTLVIAGRHDTVTLPEHGEEIAAAIPGAHLVMLPAVHLSNIELPGAFDAAVLAFLGQPADAASPVAV